MQVLFENTNVRVGWDEEVKSVYIRWDGFAYGEEMRLYLDKLLQVVKEKKASKELANLQNQRMTSREDGEWIVKNWLPRARAAGLKYAAFVIPKSEHAKDSFNKMMEQSDKEYHEAFFESEEAARDWLRKVG